MRLGDGNGPVVGRIMRHPRHRRESRGSGRSLRWSIRPRSTTRVIRRPANKRWRISKRGGQAQNQNCPVANCVGYRTSGFVLRAAVRINHSDNIARLRIDFLSLPQSCEVGTQNFFAPMSFFNACRAHRGVKFIQSPKTMGWVACDRIRYLRRCG